MLFNLILRISTLVNVFVTNNTFSVWSKGEINGNYDGVHCFVLCEALKGKKHADCMSRYLAFQLEIDDVSVI